MAYERQGCWEIQVFFGPTIGWMRFDEETYDNWQDACDALKVVAFEGCKGEYRVYSCE